jgi:oligogalacturonide lyase
MTRRTVLGLFPGAVLAAQKRKAKSRGLPPARGEFVRFIDRLTENMVVRLTLPACQNLLPARENRFVSSREAFLVFTSDRGGAFAPFRANLRTGVITQLDETEALDPQSLALDARERELWLIDGTDLKVVNLQNLKARTLLDNVKDFSFDGKRAPVVVRRGSRLERWTPAGSSVLADGVSGRGIMNPTGSGCLFSREETPGEREYWFAPFSPVKPRLLAKGKISSAYWRPDGQTLLFLRQVEHPRYLASELREAALDGSAEHVISETTQFAAFAPNTDGSVFVGASRSKAQPDIVLLLRSTRREMVLCEHRASKPESVTPSFSPNSQRVYFQSDHEGKSAIYSVNVERLIEETEEQTG